MMLNEYTTSIEYVQPPPEDASNTFTAVVKILERGSFHVAISNYTGRGEGNVSLEKRTATIHHMEVAVEATDSKNLWMCVIKAGCDLGGRGGGRNMLQEDLIIGYSVI